MTTLKNALEMAEEMLITAAKSISKVNYLFYLKSCSIINIPIDFQGYVIQKKEDRPKSNEGGIEPNFLLTNQEFHPFLYAQHENQPYKVFETFDQAVDEFFSTLEGQKIDIKVLLVSNYEITNFGYSLLITYRLRLFKLNEKR